VQTREDFEPKKRSPPSNPKLPRLLWNGSGSNVGNATFHPVPFAEVVGLDPTASETFLVTSRQWLQFQNRSLLPLVSDRNRRNHTIPLVPPIYRSFLIICCDFLSINDVSHSKLALLGKSQFVSIGSSVIPAPHFSPTRLESFPPKLAFGVKEYLPLVPGLEIAPPERRKTSALYELFLIVAVIVRFWFLSSSSIRRRCFSYHFYRIH